MHIIHVETEIDYSHEQTKVFVLNQHHIIHIQIISKLQLYTRVYIIKAHEYVLYLKACQTSLGSSVSRVSNCNGADDLNDLEK